MFHIYNNKNNVEFGDDNGTNNNNNMEDQSNIDYVKTS